jgi:predicted house-cleaning noncanonical NTP pyrophosphatase (MazG superfamily)
MLMIPWKLVRDRVPTLIKARGAQCLTKQLEGRKYVQAIAKKLVEEAKEVGAAKDRASLISELADLQEVFDTYRSANMITLQEVEHSRRRKLEHSGGFKEGLFLYLIFGTKEKK